MTIGPPSLAGCQVGASYRLVEIIGHGSYSTVWKAVRVGGAEGCPVAIKVITKKSAPTPIEKEILLHKSLVHPNIARLLEVLEDEERVYMVQELCIGGELFERIEPDCGFPEEVAHFYFVQLLAALGHLHEYGIAHRDVKPENLLLDKQGNLKLTDFGLATLFRKGTVRRRLTTRCGTALYMAPEVLEGSYEGDEADLWSCAVVLFVMLLGCHPWEEPTSKCSLYRHFLQSSQHEYSPWSSLSLTCRDLLERMLRHRPADRQSRLAIQQHPWLRRSSRLLDVNGQCCDPRRLYELMARAGRPRSFGGDVDAPLDMLLSTELGGGSPLLALTQPELPLAPASSPPSDSRASVAFSQPNHRDVLPTALDETRNQFSHNHLIHEYHHPSPPDSPKEEEKGREQNVHLLNSTPLWGSFSLRLTRFYCHQAPMRVLDLLGQILDSLLILWKKLPASNQISFATVDRRKSPLTGEIMAIRFGEGMTLVVFSKSRGDGLEFRRLFNMITTQARESSLELDFSTILES